MSARPHAGPQSRRSTGRAGGPRPDAANPHPVSSANGGPRGSGRQRRIPAPEELRADRDGPVTAAHAGRVPYRVARAWQRDLVDRRRPGEVGDVLLTLEHSPVYTTGRRTDPAHLLWSPRQREARGIDLVETDRGGDVTYHGPGQLVAYPILKLSTSRGVVAYVRALEEVGIRLAASLGVAARRDPDYTGVWVGDAKLAAIGVRVASPGITSHGLALNVDPDLSHFAGIVPCGIADRPVCSLASLGVAVEVGEVVPHLREAFAGVFACSLERADLNVLDLTAEAHA